MPATTLPFRLLFLHCVIRSDLDLPWSLPWSLSCFPPFLYQGVTSWFVFYLIKEKGVSDAAQAAVRVSGLELGGLVGSLIAGRLSDMMINKSRAGEGAVGKRVQVTIGGGVTGGCVEVDSEGGRRGHQWLSGVVLVKRYRMRTRVLCAARCCSGLQVSLGNGADMACKSSSRRHRSGYKAHYSKCALGE